MRWHAVGGSEGPLAQDCAPAGRRSVALRMCVGLFLQEIKFKGPDESVRVCLRVCVCVRARCGRLAQGKECSLVFYDNRDFKEHYKQVHPRTRIPSGDQVRKFFLYCSVSAHMVRVHSILLP